MTPEEIRRRLEDLRKKKSVTARELLPVLEAVLGLIERQEAERKAAA